MTSSPTASRPPMRSSIGRRGRSVDPGSEAAVARGVDTLEVGVDLQSEARKEGFGVTLECIQAKQIGIWDGILGHARDRPGATAIANCAASVRFPGAKLRNDPCGGFEVYVRGFADQRAAQSWAEAARGRGFPDAVAELN